MTDQDHASPKKSRPRVRLIKRDKDPEVGYGRPPPQYQFKPGQSGNLKGRPKGSKNESTILRDLLERKIDSRTNGRVRKISVMEGIHLKMVEKALLGDTKTAAFLLNRFAALVSGELRPEDLSDDDREVLEAFSQRIKKPGAQS